VVRDLFKASKRVSVPPDADMWRLTSHVGDVMERALAHARQPRKVEADKTIMVTADESRIGRSTYDELQAAVQEHDLEPRLLSKRLVVQEDEHGLSLTELWIWGFFRSHGGPHLDVDLSGPNRVIVDGLAAVAERTLHKIEADGFRIAEPTRALPSTVDTPSNPPAMETSTSLAAPASSEEGASAWIKRTWRDHTMTFLITVIGGLAVVALAVWLGIAQG
jgi:hypothetical protein